MVKKIEFGADPTILYLLVGVILVSNIVNFYQVAQVYSTSTNIMKIIQAGSNQTAQPVNQTQPVQTQDAEVRMMVLNDKTCTLCDASGIINSLETQIFTNLKVTELDYSTQEGKAVAQSLGIDKLPAFVFDESVKDSTNYQTIQQYLEQKGSSYILRAGGNMYIGREQATKPTIALFVMSQCPYGTLAENNMKEVVDTFKEKLDFKIYFIANDNGQGGFDSLHGQPEVDENLRQICAMNLSTNWFDFVICRNKNIQNATWQPCAAEAGIDANIIKACAEGEQGKQLLRENIKLADELQVGSSPTFLINNRYTFGGARPADGIKEVLCQANPGLAGCETTLTQESAAASGGCG